MLTIRLTNEDAMFVLAAVKRHSDEVLYNISRQLVAQQKPPEPAAAAATVTVKRKRGRPPKAKKGA